MDLYTNPPPSTYQLGLSKPFLMPTVSGSTLPAVAVTKSTGDAFNSFYTILITLIFIAIGKLVADLIITLMPIRKNPNRMAILVAFYNTGDVFSLIFLMLNYVWRIWGHVRTRSDGQGRDWGTLALAAGLFIVAAVVFGGGIAAGILIPQNLLMGSVARVNPDAVFYYNPPVAIAGEDIDVAALQEAFSRVDTVAALRSLGIVEQSRDLLKKKVRFERVNHPAPRGGSENPELAIEYSYSLSGFELGFQRAPTLIHSVTGYCQTEYGWLNQSTAQTDRYVLWPGDTLQERHNVGLDPEELPGARFNSRHPSIEHPDSVFIAFEESLAATGTVQYAIVPHLAHKPRIFPENSDPWYITELRPNLTETDVDRYRIRRGRPVLSCSETLLWEWSGVNYTTFQLIDRLTDGILPISPFWPREVFAREFTSTPKIVALSNNLATSALGPATQNFHVNGYIESAVTSTFSDIERLVLTAYVGARETIRNTAVLRINIAGLQNAIRIDDEGRNVTQSDLDERADFVLQSSEITTLSVRVLISTPLVFLFLWIIISSKRQVLSARWLGANNHGVRSRYVSRSTALSAVQLFRYLDESIFGERRWDGRLSSVPFVGSLWKYDKYKKMPEEGARGELVPVSAQVGKEGGLFNERLLFRFYSDYLRGTPWKEPETPPKESSREDSARGTLTKNGSTETEAGPSAEGDPEKQKDLLTEKSSNTDDDGNGISVYSPKFPPTDPSPAANPISNQTSKTFALQNLPIVTNCIEPRLVPLYRHVAANEGARSVSTGRIDPESGNPVYLQLVEGKFELAMTTEYREKLTEVGKKVTWNQVVGTADIEGEERGPNGSGEKGQGSASSGEVEAEAIRVAPNKVG